MSWLNELVVQHKEFEAPLSFWYWSGLAAISAVVKDNVWVDRHLFKLYPNIFVLLYADSGLKKGAPIAMAKQLVSKVNNTKIISGRSSIQGILKDLSQAETKPGGVIATNVSAFICASEFSSSIVDDPAALNILTDLFDRSWNSEYVSLLKMEKFTLKAPIVTLIGGINAAHAEALFEAKDIKGGFLGRSFVIHESKRNQINDLIEAPNILPDNDKMAVYLKELSAIKGPFQSLAGTHAGKLYKDWYHDFVNKLETQRIEDTTGTLNRFSESVMKVAMLLSLSESPELVINENTMAQAIETCEKLIGNIRKTTMGSGKSAFAQEKALFLKELLEREPYYKITREQLNRKFMMHASAKEWDDIADQLQVAGAITIETVGGQVVYQMPEKNAIQLKNHLKGKL